MSENTETVATYPAPDYPIGTLIPTKEGKTYPFLGKSQWPWNEKNEETGKMETGYYYCVLRRNEDKTINDSPDSVETKAIWSVRDRDWLTVFDEPA